jgi:hypothetical protein
MKTRSVRRLAATLVVLATALLVTGCGGGSSSGQGSAADFVSRITTHTAIGRTLEQVGIGPPENTPDFPEDAQVTEGGARFGKSGSYSGSRRSAQIVGQRNPGRAIQLPKSVRATGAQYSARLGILSHYRTKSRQDG